jgi:cysteine synthase A
MEELAAKEDHVWVNQLFNKENPQAHVAYTGPEIWEQTNGEVDVFVHGIGTGGCIAGVGEYLKSKKASVKVCALEPTESRVHVGEAPAPHGIVGWAPGVHSSFLEGHGWEKEKLSDKARGIVDEWGHVATPDAVKMCLHVTQTEGMMIGPSSGAAIKYAFDIASRPESAGKTIVVVVPSHGIRYTTHPMWLASQTEAGVALPAGPPVMDKEAPLIAWKSEEYKPE